VRPGTRLVATATAVALAYLPTAARADFATGNDLWKYCQEPVSVGWGCCAGYTSGIADAMSHSVPVFGWRACPSETVTTEQTPKVMRRIGSAINVYNGIAVMIRVH
jgi:hypothetical protein